jgi:hypothetical protein
LLRSRASEPSGNCSAPSSPRSASEKPRSANFVAEYTAVPGEATLPATEEMNTA